MLFVERLSAEKVGRKREKRERKRDKELNFILVLLPKNGVVLGECEDSG